MVKKWWIICCVLMLTGCGDVLDIEDTVVMLVLCIDEGKEEKYTFYQMSPVFSIEASEKSQVLEVQANSVREAAQYFDVMSNGSVVTGKIQAVILSKKLLEKEEPLPIIDYFYRDSRSSSNAYVVMYNGPVDDLIRLETPDKPRFGIFLNNLLKSAYQNETTADTTLALFRKRVEQKTVTPYIPELATVKDGIRVTGVALLNEKGTYVDSLDIYNSAILLILTRQVNEPVPFILELNDAEQVVSMNISNANYDYTVKESGGTFDFTVEISMDVTLEEVVTENEEAKDKKKLTKMIETEMEKKAEELIKRMQEQKIDPVGFGLYARAYEYEKWKKIEDKWFEVFSQSTVNVKPKIEIKDFGIIESAKQ